MNNYKEKAAEVLEGAETYAQEGFINKEDVSRILELAYKNDKINALEDLTFSAKFVKGLVKIIKSTTNEMGEEYFNKIKREYSENLEKLKENLSEIIEGGSDFIKNVFNDKYLQISQKNLENLNSLCDDLSNVKLYLNDQKKVRS
jgi:hypothetical protein